MPRTETETEINYRLLFESSMNGILFSNPDGTIYSANPAACEILGYTEEEICQLGRNGILDTSDPNLQEAINERARNGSFSGELIMKRKDGTTFPVELNSKVFNLNNGSLRTCINFRDITEEKKIQQLEKEMETRLIHSERRFRSLIQHSSDVIMLLDANGTVQYISAAIVKITGFTPEQVQEKSSFDFVHPDDLSIALGAMSSLLEAPKKSVTRQIRVLRVEGSYIWIEVTGTNLLDDPGVNAIVVNYRDISERKAAEEKLLASERRFRSLIQNSTDLIMILNKDMIITYVSPSLEKVTGYKPEELIGTDGFNWLHPDDRAVVIENARELIEKGYGTPAEIRPKHKSKGWIWTEAIASHFEEGGELFTVVNYRDITIRKNSEAALKQREMELKELNESKDKFFSIISHDLRNPFTSLLGLSEYLTTDFDQLTNEEIKHFAVNIHRTARSVFNLLDNLLQWSQLQTGRMEYSPFKFLLNDLVDECVNIYQTNAVKKNISIMCSVNSRIYVFADKFMIESVIRNFLSNAIKFTSPGGEVQLTMKAEGNTAKISITDNGIGISEENLQKLFKLGESITTFGTNNEKGTGLGLILCKEFLTKNNGQLFIESTPGHGTTFTFTLPIA